MLHRHGAWRGPITADDAPTAPDQRPVRPTQQQYLIHLPSTRPAVVVPLDTLPAKPHDRRTAQNTAAMLSNPEPGRPLGDGEGDGEGMARGCRQPTFSSDTPPRAKADLLSTLLLLGNCRQLLQKRCEPAGSPPPLSLVMASSRDHAREITPAKRSRSRCLLLHPLDSLAR